MSPGKLYSTANMGERIKCWTYRIAAMAGIPAAVFGLAELALRGLQELPQATFFLEQQHQGSVIVTDNPYFGSTFFTPRQMRDPAQNLFPAEKAAKSERILVLGESAAMGFPRPEFGLARVLQAHLSLTHPNRTFDVIDGTMTMINSHILRDIAREALRYRPDYVVIHMGNNEVIGPYGPVGVFGKFYPALWMIRLDRWLRVHSAIVRRAHEWRISLSRTDDHPWRGLDYFSNNPIPHNDARLARMREYFRSNVRDIIEQSISRGARVVIATTAVNLDDWPPLHSFDPALDPANLAAWRQRAQAAEMLMANGEWENARREWLALAEAAPDHAETLFQAAVCLEKTGAATEAKTYYERAAKCDGYRFRADAEIASIIRDEAAKNGTNCILVEARDPLQNRDGNDDYFLEHVHFSTVGTMKLAGLFAEAIAPSPTHVDRNELNRHLFYLPDVEFMAWSAASQFLQLDVFKKQPGYAERLGSISNKMYAASAVGTAVQAQDVRMHFSRAPANWRTLCLYGRYLLNRNENAEAAVALEKSTGIKNNHADTWELLGIARQRAGDLPGAADALERALALNAFMPESWNTLGLTWYLRGSPAIAEKHYRRALALNPRHAGALNNIGYIFYERKDYASAIKQFKSALEANPGLMEARFHLALSWMALHEPAEAESLLAGITKSHPSLARAWSTWGVLAMQQGNTNKAEEKFKRALLENPRQLDAAKNLAQLYTAQGNPGKVNELIAFLARQGVVSPELEQVRAK